MHPKTAKSLSTVLLAALLWVPELARAAENVPADGLAALESGLASSQDLPSEARKRLAIKRIVRDAQKLFEEHPQAPDRYKALDLAFRAQGRLVAIDNSNANRKAWLEICRQMVQAPDAMAELRFDADLLLSQSESARQGADDSSRLNALKPLVARYRDTPAESKAIRVAIRMAQDMGGNRMVQDLRGMAQERFPTDLKMLAFLREQIQGQTFTAPVSGAYTRWDGKPVRFPMDLLGRTTNLVFWSKEGDGLERLKAIAEEWKKSRNDSRGRLDVISFNLDDLTDGGHSIIAGLGLDDWQVIQLPGGKEHPAFKAYARIEPCMVTVSPTGYAALHAVSGRRISMDYSRWMQSSLARIWTDPSYGNQLTSLFTGEFLILDPVQGFDAAKPPELKGQSGADHPTPLNRGAGSLPEEELKAIQNGFLMPPARYQVGLDDLGKRYQEVVRLCRETITRHPQAPDLWLVRNRLIVALLGLWKIDYGIAYHEQAVEVAQALVDSPHPPGMDLVARFCLAKAAMRDPEADLKRIITAFLDQQGGERAGGPAWAAAAMLALDAGEAPLYERLRDHILAHHIKDPRMWTVASFLLDRFHRYRLFEAPFSGGRIPGYLEGRFLSSGKREEFDRKLAAGFKTLDGKPLALPEEAAGKWTVICFDHPWEDKKQPRSLPFARSIQMLNQSRGRDDIRAVIAVMGDPTAEAPLHTNFGKDVNVPVMRVDGGMNSPLIHQLGILRLESQLNSVLLDPDGHIAVSFSGWVHGGTRVNITQAIRNVIECADEKAVTDALAAGNLEKARQLAFQFAPPRNPDATNQKTDPPAYSVAHLSSRARVYMAMGDWPSALKDAEEILDRETQAAGVLAQVTPEMQQAEALRDSILKHIKPAGE